MSKNTSIQDWYNENLNLYREGGDVLFSDVLDIFLMSIPAGGKILDIGCGLGRDVNYFSEKGFNATGIDISKEMIKHAKAHFQGEFLMSDMKDTKQARNSFDAVWSSSALFTHLNKDERIQALREVVRILKPNAVFGFIAMKKDNRPFPKKQIPFYRFSEKELVSELSKQGFVIKSRKLISFRTREWVACIAKIV